MGCMCGCQCCGRGLPCFKDGTDTHTDRHTAQPQHAYTQPHTHTERATHIHTAIVTRTFRNSCKVCTNAACLRVGRVDQRPFGSANAQHLAVRGAACWLALLVLAARRVATWWDRTPHLNSNTKLVPASAHHRLRRSAQETLLYQRLTRGETHVLVHQEADMTGDLQNTRTHRCAQ